MRSIRFGGGLRTWFIGVALLAGCGGADQSSTSVPSTADYESTVTRTVAEQAFRPKSDDDTPAAEATPMAELEVATLGAGCFWCIEAVLDRIEGIEEVESGYMGGQVPNPTYQEVCTGTTGHAEVVQVKFDPKKITYEQLLEVFWQLHDPTTLNRQGADVGTQYRSAIFYHSDEQRQIAEKSKEKWDKSRKYRDKIVTEITAQSTFYPAEDYHQEFFANNPENAYCRYNIIPKFKKLGLLKRSDR